MNLMMSLEQAKSLVGMVNDYMNLVLRFRELKSTHEEHTKEKEKIAKFLGKVMDVDDGRTFVEMINRYVDVGIKVTELQASQEDHNKVKREMSKFISQRTMNPAWY